MEAPGEEHMVLTVRHRWPHSECAGPQGGTPAMGPGPLWGPGWASTGAWGPQPFATSIPSLGKVLSHWEEGF